MAPATTAVLLGCDAACTGGSHPSDCLEVFVGVLVQLQL